jgi:hypothetical protein
MYYADNSAWTTDIASLDKYVDADMTSSDYSLASADNKIRVSKTVTDTDIKAALDKISAVSKSGDVYSMIVK